jgi:hypothetical protein
MWNDIKIEAGEVYKLNTPCLYCLVKIDSFDRLSIFANPTPKTAQIRYLHLHTQQLLFIEKIDFNEYHPPFHTYHSYSFEKSELWKAMSGNSTYWILLYPNDKEYLIKITSTTK